MCAVFRSTDHSPRLLKSPLHCAITLKSRSDPRIPTPDFWDSFCQSQGRSLRAQASTTLLSWKGGKEVAGGSSGAPWSPCTTASLVLQQAKEQFCHRKEDT